MRKEFIPVKCITERDLPPVLRIFWKMAALMEFKIACLITALTCFCAMSPRLVF